jgi:hypothetical protein
LTESSLHSELSFSSITEAIETTEGREGQNEALCLHATESELEPTNEGISHVVDIIFVARRSAREVARSFWATFRRMDACTSTSYSRRTTDIHLSTIFRTDSNPTALPAHVRSQPVQGIYLSLGVGTFRPIAMDDSY